MISFFNTSALQQWKFMSRICPAAKIDNKLLPRRFAKWCKIINTRRQPETLKDLNAESLRTIWFKNHATNLSREITTKLKFSPEALTRFINSCRSSGEAAMRTTSSNKYIFLVSVLALISLGNFYHFAFWPIARLSVITCRSSRRYADTLRVPSPVCQSHLSATLIATRPCR